ncbi:hypothetical protein PR048_033366, partial [Dryococelus australis]
MLGRGGGENGKSPRKPAGRRESNPVSPGWEESTGKLGEPRLRSSTAPQGAIACFDQRRLLHRRKAPKCHNNQIYRGAMVAERLAHSPPTKKDLAQSPPVSPDFRKWESCRTMPLVSGFPRGSPAFPAPSFPSITLIGSQDIAANSRPNLLPHSDLHFNFRPRRPRWAEWLDYSPPTRENQAQFPGWITPGIFPSGDRAGRCRWSVGFSRGAPISRALAYRRCSVLISFHLHRLSRPH